MDQQPKIPTLKDSQKPQVKVRGMSIGLTLAERLKQFRKKDLAFILAGLGVLFMAPLAEHFMMAPESADGSLQAGWGRGGSGASNMFGAGGSPYDRTDGLAPGSPTGGGSDVITPLNVRDPSALVMGVGGTQQPPTNSALPAAPPASANSNSDLRDALAASARGIGGAAKKALLPVPKIALGGSGLRGLGVAGGGSSSSASLGPISAGSVPNKAAGGDSTSNARAMKGFQGVTRGQSSGGGGMDALKAAADKQADNMNRGTGAASDLNAAANTAIPMGGDGRGGGGPGAGKEDKGFGGNQDKGNKTIGESLAFLNMKERMQKDLELEYKKKEQDDMGLLWGKMRNAGMETFFTKGLIEPFAAAVGKCISNATGGEELCFPSSKPAATLYCTGAGSTGSPTGLTRAKVKEGGTCTVQGKEGKAERPPTFILNGATLDQCSMAKYGETVGTWQGCSFIDDPIAGAGGTTPAVDNAAGVAGASPSDMAALAGLGDVCTKINDEKARAGGNTSAVNTYVTALETEANLIVGAQVALLGGAAPAPCKGTPVDGVSTAVKVLLKDSIEALGGVGAADGGVIKSVKDGVDKVEGSDALNTDVATTKLEAALAANNAVSTHLSEIVATTVPPEIANNVLSNQRVTEIVAGMAAAKKVVKTMVLNMDGVRKVLDEQKQEIDKMVPSGFLAGTLNKVQGKNASFAIVKDAAEKAEPKLTVTLGAAAAAGEGTEAASNNGTTVNEKTTTDAIKAVTTPLSEAKAKIEAYTEEKDPTKREALKASVETAIKAAEKAVVDMRAAQTGWATAVKAVLQAQERFVVTAIPAATAGGPALMGTQSTSLGLTDLK